MANTICFHFKDTQTGSPISKQNKKRLSLSHVQKIHCTNFGICFNLF